MAVSSACILAVLVGLCIATPTVVVLGRIDDHLEIGWGPANVSADGEELLLYLYQNSSSGFLSKEEYMYVRADVQIKLVPNNSAGTVATFYFISTGPWEIHDEIDLEFLGNVSGQPYTLHTNIFVNGTGGKEQQFRLWFDAGEEFHTYSIVWTQKNILVLVDGTPIREFRNHTSYGVAYPSTPTMQLEGTLWNADSWATQGGRVKTDWSKAPFLARYRNFVATTSSPDGYSYYEQELDETAREDMKRKRDEYMIYNYCTDKNVFVNGTAPPQCSLPGTG